MSDETAPEGAEVSMEEAAKLLGTYFIHTGEEEPLRTKDRRIVSLIEFLEEAVKEDESFAEKEIKVTAFVPVDDQESGRKGLAEKQFVSGEVTELMERLRASVLSKEDAAVAIGSYIAQVFERSTLVGSSYTLVFEEEDGPTCTGNSQTVSDASAQAVEVLMNAMFGHAQQFSAQVQKQTGKELIVPANGDKEIILPGDPRFRRN